MQDKTLADLENGLRKNRINTGFPSIYAVFKKWSVITVIMNGMSNISNGVLQGIGKANQKTAQVTAKKSVGKVFQE